MSPKSFMKFVQNINFLNIAMSLKHAYAKLSSLHNNDQKIILSLSILICTLVITSCTKQSSSALSSPTSTTRPTQTAIPPTATLPPTATIIHPEPPFLAWIDPFIPQHLSSTISKVNFLSITEEKSNAQILFTTDSGPEAGAWVYLAVAPFYSIFEEVDSLDLYSCWITGPAETIPFSHILVSEDTKATFDLLWGTSKQGCVQTVDEDNFSSELWVQTDAIAILPFELINPGYKVLPVDSEDPLANDFNQAAYPLVLRLNYQLPPGIEINLGGYQYLTNFDPSKLTSVALTGVTAMVRDTAKIMEDQGVLYPAGDIQDILINSSITHINNEVPFAIDCPAPEPYQVSLRFCSDDRYIQLLEAVGTDIVELSGDHFGDWGPEAMLHTIDLYKQQGWTVYGGGRNLAEGLAPVFLTHNGNQFAFIGCNGKGIDKYATAAEDNPGAAQCDFKWMIAEISRLTSEGYIVIATMQHEEVDSFSSISLQRYDFRRLSEAGAVIVSGSQSHHPQAIEFDGSSFIHYGLGNLFFDQWHLAQVNPKRHLNKDKSFIDLHYFYNGKYIGTRLVPLQFIDNARPRPMTSEEKIPFLSEFYQYSRWNGESIYRYFSGYMSNRMDQ
jgi:hypothetical protein